MSFGKAATTSASLPDSQITRTRFTTPLGDTFQTARRGNAQVFSASLSGGSKSMLNQAVTGSQQTLRELNASPQQRTDQITRLADNQFNRQAQLINRTSDALKGKARSQLAKRFGRSGNSTFGQMQLAQLDNNRLESLMDSRLRADLLAESLNQTDMDNRFRRLGAFQNVIADINQNTRTFASLGAETLNREAALAQQRQLALIQRNDNRPYAMQSAQFLANLYTGKMQQFAQAAKSMAGS